MILGFYLVKGNVCGNVLSINQKGTSLWIAYWINFDDLWSMESSSKYGEPRAVLLQCDVTSWRKNIICGLLNNVRNFYHFTKKFIERYESI